MRLPLLIVSLMLLGLAIAPCTKAETLASESQKELLQKAEDWLVPQPTPRSRLIKISTYTSGSTKFYALGFLEPGHPGRALVGFASWDLAHRDTKDVVDPNGLSLQDISATSPFSEPQGVNVGILTGIQLIRRGNENLGMSLIKKALAEDSGHPRSPFRSPAGEPPVLMLARSCLAAAINDITSSEPDFQKIKRRIERLIADQPNLRSEATDAVLEALAASVAHQLAPMGTIERVVDDYLLGGGTTGAMSFNGGKRTPAERELILKGFEAVPALLIERHSKRFTNHLMQGFNNFVSYPMNAGQVIDAYLQRFANSEFESNWLDRQKGFTPKDEAVLEWWDEARTLGEEAYVKKYTVVVGNENNSRLSYELLLLASERYPAVLPEVYQTLLKSSLPSETVVVAFIQSDTLSREEKVELLRAGIATNHWAHRNSALSHLRDLNPAIADAHLIELLKKAPNTPDDEYWVDQDANLGRFVSQSPDLEVWRALHALIDRADLGMRMQLIEHLFPAHDASAEILRSFHDIYVRFHADEAIRDVSTSEKFFGPGAGFPHDRIAMRDFIHKHWARWLKLELNSPDEGATPDEWKAYRDAVALAVEKHDAK